MPFYADLHVHSKYSRATSRNADLENMALWARRKGITVVGTGDFTHPAWFDELRAKLVPAEPGLFRLKPEIEREVARRLPPSCRGPLRFLLEVEISTIYKKAVGEDDRTRKVHHLLYAANFATAAEIRARLGKIGNLNSDGRPILGLDSRDLLEITLESGPDAYLVPAHIWTPWFAAMGSKSGFDSIEACYGDLAGHIFAVETGLSSDPPMNWRVSSLDRFTLVSNSDAHSPPMLGREACRFDTELDYFAIRRALETGEGYGGTVEFFPEEGKYHMDGHRACGVRLDPQATRQRNGRCPECGKALTVGVMHRIETLADRPEGAERPGEDRSQVARAAGDFRSLVPLPEMVSEIRGVGPKSKTVQGAVAQLSARLGPEIDILERLPLEDLRRGAEPLLAEAVGRLRAGEVHREAGYDGEYGVIRLFAPGELERRTTIAPLFAMPAMPTMPEPSPPSNRAAAPLPASLTPLEPQPATDPASPPSPLDPEQEAAAATLEGPLLLIAGPGTGKTRTLTHRLARLIETGRARPEECLAVTFTRRAAGELRQRLAGLLGAERAGSLTVTTFHGLGLKIVQEQRAALGLPEAFQIAEGEACLELVAKTFQERASAARRRLARIRALRGVRADRKSTPNPSFEKGGAPPPAPASPDPDSGLSPFSRGGPRGNLNDTDAVRYEQALRERGWIDLDDLLLLPVRLLEEDTRIRDQYRNRFRHLSVDEYQDVDPVQYRLLRLLTPADGNLCAIGDPDQSIYRFRGAEVGFFLRFQEDFPGAKTVELRRNYRSSPAIVEAAVHAIRPASLVPNRHLQPMAREGAAKVTLYPAASEAAEAEFVAHTIERLLGGTSHFSLDSGRVEGQGEAAGDLSFDDFAVLYRSDAQADALQEALARAGIPHQKRSHRRLAERSDVRRLVEALRLLKVGEAQSPASVESLLVGIAEEFDLPSAVELLRPLAAHCGDDRERFLDAMALDAEIDSWDPRAQRVSLLTLHAAKGLEFPVVFLVGCEDGLLPLRHGETLTDAERDEERRLFFVGLTRAETHLYLSWARLRRRHGKSLERQPSPFLRDIPARLIEEAPAPTPPRRPEAPRQLRLL
jgi:DNA helicase II / ATP-dependent DNA helicase PcrA